jgi:hypothetical protein
VRLPRSSPIRDFRSHDAAFAAFGKFAPAAGTAVPALIDAFTRAESTDFAGVGVDQVTLRLDEQTHVASALGRLGPKARSALPILEMALANLNANRSLLAPGSAQQLHQALRVAISNIKATNH